MYEETRGVLKEFLENVIREDAKKRLLQLWMLFMH